MKISQVKWNFDFGTVVLAANFIVLKQPLQNQK